MHTLQGAIRLDRRTRMLYDERTMCSSMEKAFRASQGGMPN